MSILRNKFYMNEIVTLYLLNPQNIEIYITIFLALSAGLLIRIALGITGQRWVQTYHQTMTYMLLPVATLVITKVIAGNIALSLGMIGALSIVRFRNPVKSPFELTMFFCLITIGISMGVNYKWGILLTILILFVVISAKILEKISSNMGKKIFSISFSEGNDQILLEIESKKKLDILSNNQNVTQISKISAQNYFYRMAFQERKELDILLNDLSEHEEDFVYEIRIN